MTRRTRALGSSTLSGTTSTWISPAEMRCSVRSPWPGSAAGSLARAVSSRSGRPACAASCSTARTWIRRAWRRTGCRLPGCGPSTNCGSRPTCRTHGPERACTASPTTAGATGPGRWELAATPPISTYLFTLVAGPRGLSRHPVRPARQAVAGRAPAPGRRRDLRGHPGLFRPVPGDLRRALPVRLL